MAITTAVGSSNKRRNISEENAQKKDLLAKAIAKGHNNNLEDTLHSMHISIIGGN